MSVANVDVIEAHVYIMEQHIAEQKKAYSSYGVYIYITFGFHRYQIDFNVNPILVSGMPYGVIRRCSVIFLFKMIRPMIRKRPQLFNAKQIVASCDMTFTCTKCYFAHLVD